MTGERREEGGGGTPPGRGQSGTKKSPGLSRDKGFCGGVDWWPGGGV